MNYCATIIMKVWRAHYVRNFYSDDIIKFRHSKMVIYSLLLGNILLNSSKQGEKYNKNFEDARSTL